MKQRALNYHSTDRPGKIEIHPTKACATSDDLALAYTPGVACPVREIADDPANAFRYTARGNLVAVVSNGTAILGLGNLGPLASKPVMEGKGILFKRFADVDVFDLELDTLDPAEIIRTCELLEPTFGGINLEDIKAPECFEVEEALINKLNIPVFHDDQHGTAIIAGAALLGAVEVAGKKIEDIHMVFNGAGAAGIACARLACLLGVRKENILMCDSKGIIHSERTEGMNPYKAQFAQKTDRRTLADALKNADVFLGVSVKDALTPEMLLSMADTPIVFAMANPDPEITFDLARATREDVIMATGRSDYPNQVNNVLGFPFIFRGALDVHASAITDNMKIAAAHALADLTKKEVPACVFKAYDVDALAFGPDYILPKPFDPRALPAVAGAVAEAAIRDGVARAELDPAAYRRSLEETSRRLNNLDPDFSFD